MLQNSLRQAQKSQSLFAPAAQCGFRKNYNPGYYNMRFKSSRGSDLNYVDY